MMRTFITILLLVGASLLSVFYVRPEWDNFSVARKEVEELNNISTELDQIIAKRDSLLASIDAISKADQDRLDAALPKGPHGADFLVLLQNIIGRHGLVLRQINVTNLSNQGSVAPKNATGQPTSGTIALKPKPQTAINEFPVTITVAGPYESFKGFLREVETLLRVTNVTNITFASGDKQNSFEFTLQGKTYYQ